MKVWKKERVKEKGKRRDEMRKKRRKMKEEIEVCCKRVLKV